MENKSKLKFIEVDKMVGTLNEAIFLVSDNSDKRFDMGLKDSVIQRFEYSIEGIWKLLKYILLEKHGQDIASPKMIIKEAYKIGIIDDLEIFINMIDRRNRLAHDYHQNFAQYSFEEIAFNYIKSMNLLISTIKKEYE